MTLRSDGTGGLHTGTIRSMPGLLSSCQPDTIRAGVLTDNDR